jgi:hypothetical protein
MKMKDKKEEDRLKKKLHKTELQEAKKRKRQEPEIGRKDDTIDENPKILITCEGLNTEKDYFSKFKISSIDLEVIGVGDNTLSLVNKTIKIRDSKPQNYYDEVWCVFDADPKPDNPKQLQNFNSAIWEAERNGINVAYSHQAFEYWILLHFNNYQGEPMNRKLYKNALNKFLKAFSLKYDDSSDDRGKSISDDLFTVLMAKENGKRRICLAIERAEKIYDDLDLSNPAKNESSTTVFQLVKRLLGIDLDNPCEKNSFF